MIEKAAECGNIAKIISGLAQKHPFHLIPLVLLSLKAATTKNTAPQTEYQLVKVIIIAASFPIGSLGLLFYHRTSSQKLRSSVYI